MKPECTKVQLRCPDCKSDITIDNSIDAAEKIKCPVCEVSYMRFFWIELNNK